MHNVQMQIVGDELVIVCGLSPASPGRPDILASTRGNVSPHGRPDVRVSVIVFANGKKAARP